MKKFLKYVAIFFLLIAITLAAGEMIVRTVPNPYALKYDKICESGQEVTTVILGNSHPFYGLRADLMPGYALNLANVSQMLDYDNAILQSYIDSLPRLECVIQHISYTTFYDDNFENSPEWWRCVNYQLYMKLARHFALSRYSFELSHIPVFSQKLKAAFNLSSPALVSDSLGNGLGYDLDRRNPMWKAGGRDIALRHTRELDTTQFNRNVEILMDMARLCKERDVRLIVYTQPEWSTYTDAINKAAMSRTQRTLMNLERAGWLEYYDYLEDRRFTEEDFFDADHLTHSPGAVKMTEILLRDMESRKK